MYQFRMNETSVASPPLKIVEDHPLVIPAVVKTAIDNVKEVQSQIAAAKAALEAKHKELAELIGKTIVPKDENVKAVGKIVQMHPRYAFGHRLAPAYRLEVDPHGAFPSIVACDELEAGYIVEV